MKNRQAAIGFIFITIVLDVTGLGIIIPVMPDLIKQLIHGSTGEAAKWGGWLVTAYALTQFLFAPVVGALSDRYGRRPVLLLSLLGFGLDFIIMALAPDIWWLFTGRVLAGIMGASITTAMAYISDISTETNRAQNFGLVGAAFGLGFIVGPLIGGMLGELGLRVPFWAAAALSLINALYGYFVLPESLKLRNRRRFNWKRANPIGSFSNLFRFESVALLMLCYFLYQAAAHAVHSVWNYYTIEKFGWSKYMIGISLSVVGILVALVQGGLTKSVNRRLGNEKSLYIGISLFAIGMVLFAFANQGWMMFVFLVPYCLGGIVGPAFQSIVTRQVPVNMQGELQGGLTSAVSLSNIFGPLIMTNVFYFFTDRHEKIYFPGAPYILGSILFLISLGIAYLALRKREARG